MNPSLAGGLTDAEVAQRVADGKSNAVRERATRSIPDIVRANVFTRINAILGVLLLIVLATGSLMASILPDSADGAGGVSRQGVATATVTMRKEYRYLRYLPPGYETDQAQRWPLILFLHGAGERGDEL